jgi:hypothetical protein
MATFRDDVARLGRKLIETVETRTGREIVPAEKLELLESAWSDNRIMRKTLEYISYSLMNYSGAPAPGRMPQDMPQIARVASAAQSLRAWQEDPMAGQWVDLYVSFVFGRGVPIAQAHDDEVQDRLGETWQDVANQRVLTSFPKLVEKGVDAAIQSTVFFTFHDEGEDGAVRVSLLTFEDVQDAIRHPKDKYRILYWRVVERVVIYDYREARYVTPLGPAGKPKVVYYEAWGAFDDDNPVMVAQDDAAGGREALTPPADMLRPGKVYALTFNKTSDMAFGVPRMRRMIRWWTAYNEVLQSHVQRMQAAASIYMKMTAKGPGRELDRLGQLASGRASAFGASQEFSAPGPGTPSARMAAPGVLEMNDSVTADPFKIDSGASDLAASAPQLRAQGSGIFPNSYFGEQAADLAGAQSVELPVLKFIEMDQEQWADLFRAFAQARIDAAIRVGVLDEWRDATSAEQDEIAAAKDSGDELHFEVGPDGRVKRDLGFDVTLPSPLKRAMGDLVTAAVTTATAVDPNATNPELSRWLFGFILAEAFDVQDPQRIVDQVLPRHVAQGAAMGQGEIDPATGQPRPVPPEGADTITGQDGQQHPPENPGGARQKSPQPEQRPVRESPPIPEPHGRRAAALQASAKRRRTIEEAFSQDVEQVAADHLRRLGEVPAAANGNGNGPH